MNELRYIALERIPIRRPVDRISFVADQVRGKTVLDIGALDETAFRKKQNTQRWLHREICSVAKQVYGVDNSTLIPIEGLCPFPNSVILKGDAYSLETVLDKTGPVDIVVAGEVIEHLPDSLRFLQSISESKRLKGCEFVLTTPNACSLHNFHIGLLGMESTHIDHLGIHSYKTLNTLCKRAGFEFWEIIPYHVAFSEMIVSAQLAFKCGVIAFEKWVNLLEWFFPILSGGWVVRGRI